MDPAKQDFDFSALRLQIPQGISFADLSLKFHESTRAVSINQKPLRRIFAASGLPVLAQDALPLEILHMILRAWYSAALAGGEPQDTQMEWFLAANDSAAHRIN